MTLNKSQFYKTVRLRLGPLNQSQVDGFEVLLLVIDTAPLAYAAYMLSTAWHETAATMQPIKERGGEAYFTTRYDPPPAGKKPDIAKELGNTKPGDGARYAGRGYVQLTGRRNYQLATDKLGIDLIGHPDEAMHPTVAGNIMRVGMEEGWFTGKRLSSYLPDRGVATHDQYVAARRIINGTDKAELIEDYAQVFERALRDGAWL